MTALTVTAHTILTKKSSSTRQQELTEVAFFCFLDMLPILHDVRDRRTTWEQMISLTSK